MTGDRSLFLTLTMKVGGTVGFGGNQTGKIMVENLKMSHLKYFVKNMELSMNSLLLELHSKMGL